MKVKMKKYLSLVIFLALFIINIPAKAYENCYLYKKSNDKTGYNACESRNNAERRDDINRKNSDEINQNYQAAQLEIQLQQLGLLKSQQDSKSLSELSLLEENITDLKKTLDANECETSKYLLDKLGKFENSSSAKLFEGKGLNFREMLIGNRFIYLAKCTDEDKFQSYLKEELNNGSIVAKNVAEKIEMKLPKSIPNLSDYGTDFQALLAYNNAINATSIKICDEAYKNKSRDGAYCLAIKAKKSEDIIHFYKEASNLGHPLAKNNLAMQYDNLHVPVLSLEIKKLILSAAQSGIPHAQVTVGWWHMTGENGFSKNYAESMQWNLKAYKQGHSEGANNIGELYENGFGVPKNLEIAISWYKKASVLGNKEATERLERLTK